MSSPASGKTHFALFVCTGRPPGCHTTRGHKYLAGCMLLDVWYQYHHSTSARHSIVVQNIVVSHSCGINEVSKTPTRVKRPSTQFKITNPHRFTSMKANSALKLTPVGSLLQKQTHVGSLV